MSISSSWIHGNALTIESPIDYAPDGQERARLILTPTGPGAWVNCEGGGMVSWLHLPIPTIDANVSRFERFELLSVFLLFQSWTSSVEFVHVYDGYDKIEEFNGAGGRGFGREGNNLVKSRANTFHLEKPHLVKSGIGLSFLFNASASFGPSKGIPDDRRLFVAAAGADFVTRSIFFSRFFSP